ncbi:hypothetical protein [Stenotrophomonas phage RAS14]
MLDLTKMFDLTQLAYRRHDQLSGFSNRHSNGKDMSMDPTVTVGIRRYYEAWMEADPLVRKIPNNHLGDWRYVLFVCDLLKDDD